ncbi:MAG: hypothetical protein ACI9DM_000233 [Cyclobacteriaceae bacterium]|jgi:hypothetical protein
MKAYLNFGGHFVGEPNGPFLTYETEIKTDLLPWQKRGLTYTATGYGARIPTTYKVVHEGRWKRVYCAIYSNSGTSFIESNQKPIATVTIQS